MKILHKKMSFWYINSNKDLEIYNTALYNCKDLEYTDVETQFYKYYFPYSFESWNKSIKENKFDFKACLYYHIDNVKYLNHIELNHIELNEEFVKEIFSLLEFCVTLEQDITQLEDIKTLNKELNNQLKLWISNKDIGYMDIVFDIFIILINKVDKKTSFLFLVFIFLYSGLNLSNIEQPSNPIFWKQKIEEIYSNKISIEDFYKLISANIDLYYPSEEYIPNLYSNKIDFKNLKSKNQEFIDFINSNDTIICIKTLKSVKG